ncbi:MAG: MBL fold metallo-hydrolase [Vicinamibacterales bacterium]
MPRHAGSRLLLLMFVLCAASCASSEAPGARTLDLWFIDVEGGQSTLIRTPSGQTMLVDAGFPGTGTFASSPGDPAVARDPQRILAVAKAAGITRIDVAFVTHFHADHVGGFVELSKLLPIGTFIDHGGVTDDAERVAGTKAIQAAYAAVREGAPHLEPRPGDRLPLDDVEATVVASAGETLQSPLAGAAPGANGACGGTGLPAQETAENPRSTGFLLQFGRFRFLDVGDLTGEPLHRLACPSDLLGPVDVYLVSHHGGLDAADPSLFAAIRPRVAVLNNGEDQAVRPRRWRRCATHGHGHLAVAPIGCEGRSEPGRAHANLTNDTAHWIRISAGEDGSFTVTRIRGRG